MSIDVEHAIGLVVATAVLGLSPGPAVFATLARAMCLPFKRVFIFISGIVLADFIFAMLAMCGVALLVSQHAEYFLILKYGGGLYLLYLGGRSLLSKASAKNIQKMKEENGWKLFTSGFLLTAGNPKDLLFFVSFLPAFIDLETADTQQMAIAAALIVITFIATLSFYAGLVSWAGKLLQNPRIISWLDNIAGLILIGVGLMVIFFN